MFKNCNQVDHNHPPNRSNVKRLVVLHKVRHRVSTEPTSITRIIEDEYSKSNLNDDERRQVLLPTAQGT
jgi:C4-type Zn-finger protein